jgi:hypothetical protein
VELDEPEVPEPVPPEEPELPLPNPELLEPEEPEAPEPEVPEPKPEPLEPDVPELLEPKPEPLELEPEDPELPPLELPEEPLPLLPPPWGLQPARSKAAAVAKTTFFIIRVSPFLKFSAMCAPPLKQQRLLKPQERVSLL